MSALSPREDLIRRIRSQSRTLDPLPVACEPRLAPLPGIQAVLFDFYGTLFVSAAGEVGSAPGSTPSEGPLHEALKASGVTGVADPGELGRLYLAGIGEARDRLRRQGEANPEIDIVELWRSLLPLSERQAVVLAVEFECRQNPVWPMPGLEMLLSGLAGSGFVMGIVSNAQFYTPLVFEALLEQSPEAAGFRPDLLVWSYRHGIGKPSPKLWKIALDRVHARDGIEPGQVLVVGNCMVNDICPAAELGCRTALFAGDARSLRWPSGVGIQPDRIVTCLADIGRILGVP